MLKERLSVAVATPKVSPSSSPRPSPKIVIPKETQKQTVPDPPKEVSGALVDDPVVSGLDGKQPANNNAETAIQQEVTIKSDACQTTVNAKEKKKKKSSWFNAFYPTYKSRSEDFKRIFKDVPDDERLVVDYSCAVQKEILVHGRLYVTQNYLCFYANIFGWETNIVLKWKNVTAITKEKTAIVIPNAVLISTKSEKYFFTSFVARDKVYLMLFRVWQNALMDKQMTNQEMWQWVHQSYGAELGLTSDDEDYIAPGTEDLKNGAAKLSSDLTSIEGNNLSSDNGNKEKMAEKNGSQSTTTTTNSTNSKKSTETHDSTNDSDFTDLDMPQCDVLRDVCCSVAHDGRQLLNETLSINVDQLFTLLFTNSKFYLDFQAARKTTDLAVQTDWTTTVQEDVEESKDIVKIRRVNQTVSLTQAIGPKTSQVSETQRMLSCSKPGYLYSINSESISGGVPYGDSFVVEVHYCLKKLTDKQSSITVNAQVKFKKSVWGLVKGMIEKNCWSGLEDYFTHLLKCLKNEAEEGSIPTDVKRKVKRKRKLYSVQATNKDPVGSLESPNRSKTVSTTVGLATLQERSTTVFIVLLIFLLFLLNVVLLHKLWSLEEEKPPSYLLDLPTSKNPPNTKEEWLVLLKKQEMMHSEEVERWRDVLAQAIDSLKKANQVLLELQKSTKTKLMMDDTENTSTGDKMEL